MRAFALALDPGTLQGAPHYAFDRGAVDRPEWRIFGEEQRTRRERGTYAFDIGDQRIADLLAERQQLFATPLAMQPDAALSPVDIIEAEPRDLAGAHAEPSQQQDDRAVAQPPLAVARGDDARDVVLG